MFKEVADIKTSDQLHLPVPEAKFETVVVQPSEHQQAMVAELSERAAAVHSGVVDPSVDNMLKITSDGRKLGLDQRLMNPLLPDDPNSKLNACVRNVLRIYEEGQSDKLTQLLFWTSAHRKTMEPLMSMRTSAPNLSSPVYRRKKSHLSMMLISRQKRRICLPKSVLGRCGCC